MLAPDAGFTIVGAGGIGGVVGAHLARAGYQVKIVEANAEHAEAIRGQGLHVSGHADFTVECRAVVPEEVDWELATVLLAVKSKDTEQAMRMITPRLSASGFVVSLQNGLEEYKIAREVGEDRTVGAFLTFGANYARPGEVVYGGPGSFRIGELNGQSSARVDELARILDSTFHPVQVTSNIFGYLWAKAALGAFYFATALVDADVPKILDQTSYRPLFGELVAEVVRVAEAEGVQCEVVDGFDPTAFAKGGDVEASWSAQYTYWASHVQQRTGVWRDLAIHRRVTEVDHIIGPVIQRARTRRIPVPLLERLRMAIKEAETGARPLSFGNLDELSGGAVAG